MNHLGKSVLSVSWHATIRDLEKHEDYNLHQFIGDTEAWQWIMLQHIVLEQIIPSHQVVILDLTEVDYLTEEAITYLMRLYRRLQEQSVRLLVIALTPFLHRKFTRLGINTFIPLYSDLKTAIDNLHSQE